MAEVIIKRGEVSDDAESPIAGPVIVPINTEQHGLLGGSYRPHCFLIRVKEMLELWPAPGDELTRGAIPTHVHEYVHYLHNISTVVGSHLFVGNVWLLRSLLSFTDEHGHVTKSGSSDADAHRLAELNRWIRLLLGGITVSNDRGRLPSKIQKWEFGNTEETSHVLEFGGGPHTLDTVSVNFKAVDIDGRELNGVIEIGYTLITEGIAYEIERETRIAGGEAGWEVDDYTDAYPYLIFRHLIEYLIGRETTALERIETGVYSLLSSSPAAELKEVAELRGKVSSIAEVAGLPRARISLKDASGIMGVFKALVQPELNALATGGAIKDAADEIQTLFRAAAALRSVNPLLETFIGAPTSVSEFLGRIATLPDCCVLQEGAGGTHHLYWAGPGLIAHEDEVVTRLALFQSAMHFAQQHFLTNGTVMPTAEISETPCPFSGACVVEAAHGMPHECKTRPWMRFYEAARGDSMCWYANGVKALARSARDKGK